MTLLQVSPVSEIQLVMTTANRNFFMVDFLLREACFASSLHFIEFSRLGLLNKTLWLSKTVTFMLLNL